MRYLFIFMFSFVVASAQFNDQPPPWAEMAVQELYELGVITGYPDGTFKGEQAISRFEMTVIVQRLINALEKVYLDKIDSRLEQLENAIGDVDSGDLANMWNMIDRVYIEIDFLTGELQKLNDALPLAEEFNDSVTNQLNTMYTTLAALENVVYENQIMFERAIADSDIYVMEFLRKEVDDKITDLKTALQNDLQGYVDSRIATLEAEIAEAVAEVEADLNQRLDTQDDEIAAIRSEQQKLAEPQETSADAWRVDAQATVGTRGNAPYFGAGLGFMTPEASVNVKANTDDILGNASYNFSESFSVGGRYRSNYLESSSGLYVEGRFSAALVAQFGAGYGRGFEVGLSAYHLGTSEAAIIPGLSLGLAGKIGFGETNTAFLIDADARFRLEFGSVALTPGIFFRNVSSEASYRAVIPGLAFDVDLGDTQLFAKGSYGFITLLSENVAERSALEAALGVRHKNIAIEAFWDSNLGIETLGDFLDDPAAPSLSRIGVRGTFYTSFGAK
jgi:hypothetical protein